VSERAVGPIRNQQSFRALRRPDRRAARGPIRITYLLPRSPDGITPKAQVGYAISRRCGNAVQRNRLRRRLRAVVAARARDGALAAGTYLVRTEPAAAALAFAELSVLVDGALAAAGTGSP
jgi:ribonuclease P protein component